MGTIAEKLSYLADTKDLFKDRLNSLGAEITSSTTFRNYLNWLDTFYGEVSDKTDLSVNGLVGRTSQNTVILPSEYTQVDYIESSGTQYIDTGVNADTNLRVLMDIAYTDLVQDNQNIGAIKLQSGNNNARYHLLLDIVHNTMRVWLNNSNYTFGDADTNRHIYDINPVEGYAKCDDNQITIPTNIRNTELNFYLFGRNSTSTIYMAKIKQWACKMYYNNELVRDFIPCYRNSDNEVGLYDLVNDVFYTNGSSSSIPFTYGAVVSIPNPDYPQPINNLSGDVAYKVSGKNLFDISKVERNVYYNYGTTGSVPIIATSDKRLTLSPTNSIKVKPSTQYTLSFPSAFRYAIAEMENNYISLGDSGWKTNTTYTFTTNATTNYIGFNFSKTDNSTITDNDWDTFINSGIQLEENSTSTDFEPYISQTFNIPLGDIELGKITLLDGTTIIDCLDKIYSEKGKFYLEKNINKIVLNGSEGNWNLAQTNTNTLRFQNTKALSNGYVMSANKIISNLFMASGPTDNADYEHIRNAVRQYPNYLFIVINKDRLSEPNLASFVSWLSTHNVIVYYALVEPTTTEITQENYPSLYNALKQIQDYLTSYKINKEFILGYSSPEIEY